MKRYLIVEKSIVTNVIVIDPVVISAFQASMPSAVFVEQTSDKLGVGMGWTYDSATQSFAAPA